MEVFHSLNIVVDLGFRISKRIRCYGRSAVLHFHCIFCEQGGNQQISNALAMVVIRITVCMFIEFLSSLFELHILENSLQNLI